MAPHRHLKMKSSELHHFTDYENGGLVQQFVQAKLKTIKKAQYGIIFVVCTAVLLFQVGQCAFKYLDKETGTADKYVHVSNTSFPELTICPTYPYREDVLQVRKRKL